jgi:hypothetical protein
MWAGAIWAKLTLAKPGKELKAFVDDGRQDNVSWAHMFLFCELVDPLNCR